MLHTPSEGWLAVFIIMIHVLHIGTYYCWNENCPLSFPILEDAHYTRTSPHDTETES